MHTSSAVMKLQAMAMHLLEPICRVMAWSCHGCLLTCEGCAVLVPNVVKRDVSGGTGFKPANTLWRAAAFCTLCTRQCTSLKQRSCPACMDTNVM